VICPWCFAGKRLPEKALDLLGVRQTAQVVWRPFELNPGMPPHGMSRRAYREAKFGSWERSLALEERVRQAGCQDAVVESLFRAYFLDGENAGGASVLDRIAAGNGVARHCDESAAALRRMLAEAHAGRPYRLSSFRRSVASKSIWGRCRSADTTLAH
jgi:predicted DsbA family dithiol-disulfide isomerase